MLAPVLVICFILIILMIVLIIYNIDYYNKLIKDTWMESPIILTILLALSLTVMTVGTFINYKDNTAVIPIYLMIIFFEYIWIITTYNRMYTTATAITTIIFLLSSFEMVFLVKGSDPILCWTITPFLFLSLLQIVMTDILYKNNLDHTDIINI